MKSKKKHANIFITSNFKKTNVLFAYHIFYYIYINEIH